MCKVVAKLRKQSGDAILTEDEATLLVFRIDSLVDRIAELESTLDRVNERAEKTVKSERSLRYDAEEHVAQEESRRYSIERCTADAAKARARGDEYAEKRAERQLHSYL